MTSTLPTTTAAPNPPAQQLQELLNSLRDSLGSPPYGVLDLTAARANAGYLAALAKGKPIRIATKSVRCTRVLDELLQLPGYQGLLALTLPEALRLHELGYRDIVVGYPTTDAAALRQLAADAQACADITLMFDSAEQLDFTDSVIPPGRRPVLRACLELDVSLRVGRSMHVGSYRSPVFSPHELRDFAALVASRPGFTPVGILAYEGQLAGVHDGGNSPRAYAVRLMKRTSRQELLPRRTAAIRAAREIFEPEFVNGGGTGSIPYTVADPSVTEVGAGSGIYAPGLFSRYRGLRLRPAAYYACPVVRRPSPGIVTVAGAGWVASGVPGADRLPTVAYPTGLDYLPHEMAGEAQTPLRGDAAARLAIGDLVLFRHAKAGELCERINEFVVVDGGEVADRWPTYRGEGIVLQ
ncbi:alanine racemase [Streptomyces sp. W16]|uniref:alanine racemase n=1 Tax=Streptomyces sp. W16 TaxID=3076631 RepID=UPI00295C3326|nr:alanine racemase [Streptomyces sp. W16]MDV9173630.1 alanine racemase [Streptomyces sp. W16]